MRDAAAAVVCLHHAYTFAVTNLSLSRHSNVGEFIGSVRPSAKQLTERMHLYQ